ncbi:MAG: C4-dicarboxylate TRAP transporter substrate-binding protein [Alphaproteobacteria bacterium]
MTLRGALLAAAGTAALAAPAHAVETINLTAISGYPPAATWVQAFKETYMPLVNEALAKDGKYKIAWNEGFSGTVVKPRGELEGVQSGIGDLGLIVTAFHADKLPLHKLTFVTPFVANDLNLVVNTMNKLEQTEPSFGKIWDSLNMVNLVLTGPVDNYFILSKKPIKSTADLKGKKIGAAGANLPWVTAAGATGVSTTLADAYNSLNTGIYEGVILWAEAAKSFKVCEQAPYIFDGGMGPVQAHTITFNKDVWAKLPAPVKQVMTEMAPKDSDAATKIVVGGATAAIEWCKATYKTEIFKPTAEEVKTWVFALNNEAKLWAEDLEKQGHPGKAILSKYMDTMRAANQPIVRHWDRE